MERIRNPRCFLVYALAPEGCAPAEANRLLIAYVADERRGLAVFHDHFRRPSRCGHIARPTGSGFAWRSAPVTATP